MMLWLCEAALPPAGNKRAGRAQVAIASRDAPAALLAAAGAAERRPPPPVVGASRAPQGHLLENLGEVAGLQRASGGTREAKWAKQNLPLCAQLGATRSRQDESKEVGRVGSKRTSSGGNGGHVVRWVGLIFRLLDACSAPIHQRQPTP
jgi:hypothetical protein